MSVATDTKKLKNIVKESLREVLALELMKLRADLLPYISEKEQKEIEKSYGKPGKKISKSVSIRI